MAAPYTTQLNRYTGNLDRTAGDYGAAAARARTMGTSFAQPYKYSIEDLARILRRRATGGDRAAFMSERIGNQNRAGTAAISAIRRDNAIAGSGGVGPSPFAAGQEAIIRGQMAANTAGAANQAHDYYEQDAAEKARELTGLYGGVVGQASADEMAALGAQRGVDSDMLQLFLTLRQQEEARKAQAKQGLLGGITGFLGAAGNIYGMTRPGPKPPTYGPAF
jgi:hypothetical protein